MKLFKRIVQRDCSKKFKKKFSLVLGFYSTNFKRSGLTRIIVCMIKKIIQLFN